MPAPTATEIRTAIAENANYQEIGSIESGRKFVTAVRQAIALFPKKSSRGGQGDLVEFDQETLRLMLQEAQKWVRAEESRASAPINGGFGLISTGRHC